MLKIFQKLQPKPKLYQKCNQLPIHWFNEISITGNLRLLQIDQNQKVSNEILENTWINILDEYFTISKDATNFSLFRKRTKMILLERKLNVLEAFQICISKGVNVDDQLKQYRIKSDKIQVNINLVRNDISRLSANIPTNEESKTSNTNFDDSIAMIIENGYQINRFTTVVSEYCSILNRIKQRQQNDTRI